MDNLLDDRRYPLCEGYECAYVETTGKQKALVFRAGASVACATTGWSRSNRAVRRAARGLAKADAELRSEVNLVELTRNQPAGVVEVLERVLGGAR